MTATFEAILAKARPTEKSVRLCLGGDLFAEHERINAELAAGSGKDATLAGDDTAELRAQLADVRERMKEATVTFRFRALPRTRYEALRAAHRSDDPAVPFTDAMWPALVAECAVEPAMSPAQVEALFESLGEGQRDVLCSAAWEANTSRGLLPF